MELDHGPSSRRNERDTVAIDNMSTAALPLSWGMRIRALSRRTRLMLHEEFGSSYSV